MKKIIYLLALLPLSSIAQQSDVPTKTEEKKTEKKATPVFTGGKNVFKTNLSSLALKNYSFTYERLIYNKMSFAVSYRFMPKGNLPLEKAITDFIDNKDINVGLFEMGNWAITPEVRFYAHKRMKGFYIAPYARIAGFDVTLPVNYAQSGKPEPSQALFTGTIKSFSGGLMLGVQQQLFKKITLDIWIIGAHYGSSTGDLNATFGTTLNSAEKNNLQSAINKIDASPFVVKGTVNADGKGAVLTTDGPWAGVRGAGINIGFRF